MQRALESSSVLRVTDGPQSIPGLRKVRSVGRVQVGGEEFGLGAPRKLVLDMSLERHNKLWRCGPQEPI